MSQKVGLLLGLLYFLWGLKTLQNKFNQGHHTSIINNSSHIQYISLPRPKPEIMLFITFILSIEIHWIQYSTFACHAQFCPLWSKIIYKQKNRISKQDEMNDQKFSPLTNTLFFAIGTCYPYIHRLMQRHDNILKECHH